ncbi:sigma-70 family RNA polymerase sigma factor [Echinicola strongylocentroti]|uniref:Sigma-70 family RNA polymerase sigma factor n=1 Tax=Echinicola strongylocentroti TaxID=1795355 RepID=A0A2Z4IP41_9BACT|nr:sigma-70 family RNA polymerase sigma factor [Echinicola strongylocentroti]AWW32891.1 sigma-70 family RNA polymerase sigma factor [Echinicola strongylocentroti]
MKKTQNTNSDYKAEFPMLLMKHSKIMIVYADKSDFEVWSSFKNGDETAFNYIYRKHAAELYNYGMQVCQQNEWVLDCLQAMFVDVRRKRMRLGDVHSIKGYLFTVFHRELFKLIRKKRKDEFVSLENSTDQFLIEASHETKLIDQELVGERKKELEEALNQLTKRERQAILLLYQEELSYREIADLMAFKEVKTARSLVYKAMAKLKEIVNVNGCLK